MGLGTGATAAITAGLGAAGSLGSAAIQSSSAQGAINQSAPYAKAGEQSLAELMKGFQNGTFGPGSIPGFTAPTAQQAQATPGYQFTQDQGNRAILAHASAGGGSLGGAALKELDQYNTGLANSTYGDTFNRALQTYQAQLAGQSQNYNELAGVAQTGQTAAQNIGGLMTQQGNVLGAGLVGATNSATQGLLLNQLGRQIGGPGGVNDGGLSAGYTPSLPELPPFQTPTFAPPGLGVG